MENNYIAFTYLILKFFILINIIIFAKALIIIQANFNSIDNHNIYCDERINFYGTSNLNVYKISDEGNKININSKLKVKTYNGPNPYNFFCPKIIYYLTSSTNESISIEFNHLNDFTGIFRNSTAVYIEIKSGNFDNFNDYTSSFSSCYQLISIDLSNFSFKKAIGINGMFEHSINLEKIIWPINIQSDSLIQACTMFNDCPKITSVD